MVGTMGGKLFGQGTATSGQMRVLYHSSGHYSITTHGRLGKRVRHFFSLSELKEYLRASGVDPDQYIWE